MKMKISDIIKKSSDETVAKIIGAVIAMQTEGISEKEALKLEYPQTLKTLQSEMEVDYTPTNADRIRSMSDEELAEFLVNIHEPDDETIVICNKDFFAEEEILDWLQSEVEE